MTRLDEHALTLGGAAERGGQRPEAQADGKATTTVLIGDDHRLFAEAMGAMLTQCGYVVEAIVSSDTEAVATAATRSPDVCLLGERFSEARRLDVIDQIIAACPRTRVIVVAACEDPVDAAAVLARGAMGYVHKSRGVGVLTDSISRVMAGELVVDSLAAPGAVRRDTAASDAEWLCGYLTTRERECLELLVEGLSTKSMARRLGVATTTIRTHVQAVLTKLGAHSRLEAAAFAVRHGLTRPTDVTASWGSAM